MVVRHGASLVLCLAFAATVMDGALSGARRANGDEKASRRASVGEGKVSGDVCQSNCLQLRVLWIAPGTFMMGSPKTEQGRFFNEDQVRVTITKAFWIGETEVTQGQWKQLMHTTPWKDTVEVREGDEYPATFISAEDAMSFCKRLSAEERSKKRLPRGWEFCLPTEAQWEYACRAGTTTRFYFGDQESQLGQYAWYRVNTGDVDELYAHRVRQKRPNRWGLYDMQGNVTEWCQDRYTEKLTGGVDPIGKSQKGEQTFVGGCWIDEERQCRSAFRNGVEPSTRTSYIGFRVAVVQIGTQ